MSNLPSYLEQLLSTDPTAGRSHADGAWRAFVADHTLLLLHVARSFATNHDDAMDAYAFMLEQLRADDFRRLREFAADPRSKLSTWLVVVARRLCLDLYRRRYGRERPTKSREQRAMRRRLHDLVNEGFELTEQSAPRTASAELALRRAELQMSLESALATLEPRDQLLLKLRFDEDLAAHQIADVLQFPSPFHVYRRVNALLAQLRQLLQQRGVESPVP